MGELRLAVHDKHACANIPHWPDASMSWLGLSIYVYRAVYGCPVAFLRLFLLVVG